MKPELFEITTGRGEATRMKAALAHKHLVELPRPYATPEPKRGLDRTFGQIYKMFKIILIRLILGTGSIK